MFIILLLESNWKITVGSIRYEDWYPKHAKSFRTVGLSLHSTSFF